VNEISASVIAPSMAVRETWLRSTSPINARAGLVEGAGEESRLVPFVGFVGNDGSDATLPRCVPVGLADVAFVADDGAGLNVGPDVEQGFEVTPVGDFAAGQVEGDEPHLLDAGRARRVSPDHLFQTLGGDPHRSDVAWAVIVRLGLAHELHVIIAERLNPDLRSGPGGRALERLTTDPAIDYLLDPKLGPRVAARCRALRWLLARGHQ
jgi:hypothetical protein